MLRAARANLRSRRFTFQLKLHHFRRQSIPKFSAKVFDVSHQTTRIRLLQFAKFFSELLSHLVNPTLQIVSSCHPWLPISTRFKTNVPNAREYTPPMLKHDAITRKVQSAPKEPARFDWH